MNPIPLIPIINFFLFFVHAAATVKVYYSYKKNEEDRQVLRLFYALLFLTLYIFIISLPGLFIRNPFYISFFFSFNHLLLLSSGYLLTSIALHFLRLERIKVYYKWFVAFSALVITTLAFLGLEDRILIVEDGIEHWIRPENVFIDLAFLGRGLILGTSLIFTLGFFIYLAFKNRDNRRVFIRSLLFSLSISFYLFSAVTVSFYLTLFQSLFTGGAALLLTATTFYNIEKSK